MKIMFKGDPLILIGLSLLVLTVSGRDIDRPLNPDAFIPCFQIRCYSDDLGCFKPLISGLIILFPPISVCPENPSIVNLTFRVANQDDTSMFLQPPTMSTPYSRLVPGRSLAFYSHGCFGSYADKFALFSGFGLLRHYYQVVLSDWVRGANPPVIYNMPIIINLFLCTANCEIVGRKIANAYAFAVQTLGIKPENITVTGHSAGSASTHFTSVWLFERYLMRPYETIGLDVVSDPYQPSTVFGVNSLDAFYNTAVHTTFNFPIPLVSHLPALDFKVGSPFALSHTDLYINAPYGLIVNQPPCGKLPFCSHFFAIIIYIAALNGCKYQPCNPKGIFPVNTTLQPTGVASSVYGRRGALCIRAPAYPLSQCKCNNQRKHSKETFKTN